MARGNWIDWNVSGWKRYLIPFAGVTAAVLIRYLTHKYSGENDTPFLLLFATVLVSATFGGLGPGILTTILAAVASSIFFQDVDLRDGLDVSETIRLLLFFLEGAFISILGARLQAARRRAEQSENEARQLEQRLLDISDAERRRFGQDLHDGLGQTLTGVAFLSKALQQRLAAQSLPEATHATQIASLVSDSIGQTRALAKGLAPVGLEDGGLPSALLQLTVATSTVFGVRCEFVSDPSLDLDDLGTSTHLYRIAQEAINNAVRHGKARQIHVQLSNGLSGIELQIEDDGGGFVPGGPSTGMGLQIMQFRAKMINGKLDIRRRDADGGTIVSCQLPVLASN